jgi:integrase
MRKGDCCTLLWTAVDLPGRFISVKTSKTGELVQIPIFPLLYEVLAKRKRDQSPYVFHEQAMKYKVHPDYLTYGLQRVMRRAGFFDREDTAAAENHGPTQGEIHQPRPNGIRKASVRDFHSFRVTWVTLALSAGVPLEIVQKVTGHRTAGIVMKHYFQPGREEFRRTLVGKLPALIGGGPERRPLEAAEVKKLLAAMTHDNWQEIRDRLVAPQTEEPAPPIQVTSDDTLSLAR